MELKELLSLEASVQSINEIELFLAEKDQKHRDYIPAYLHLIRLKLTLNFYGEVDKKTDYLLTLELDDHSLIEVLIFKIAALVKLTKFMDAEMLINDFAEIIDDGSLELRILFTKACIELYESLHQDKKVLFYQDKLNELTGNQSHEMIDTREDEDVVSLAKINKLFKSFVSKNNLSIREVFRQYLSELQKITPFDEAYLYYQNCGYYYKKERLYDKKDVFLDNTIEGSSFSNELVVNNTFKTKYLDILTNKPYQEPFKVICFKFSNLIISFRTANLEIKMSQEVLKIAALYLAEKMQQYFRVDEIKNTHKQHEFMLDNLVYGYHRQMDNRVYLSKSLQNLLELDECVMAEAFYQYFDSEDLINYKKNLVELLELPTIYRKVNYKLKVNEKVYHFEERLLANNEEILGVIEEVSDRIAKEKALHEFAYVDTLAKVYTKSKLDQDLTDLIAYRKFSLLVLNVINFKLYNEIYGMEFGDQLIYAIGMYLKEYSKLDLQVYHFDGDKFVVAVKDINDKRAIKKHAKELREYLNLKLRTLNYRVNLNFEIGILRYPTDTYEHDHKLIIEYLLSALSNAHNGLGEENIGFYDMEKYRKDMFEIQLVTHISESIDLNHLKLEYSQVVNLKDNSCAHYLPHLNLTNYAVGEDEIYRVLRKRGLVGQIERYIIHKALYELMEMYKEAKRYFSFVFKISEETLKGENFVQYILEQLKFFGVPKEAIIIHYNDSNDEDTIKVLNSLAQNEITIASSSVELLKRVKINYFFYELPSYVQTLENEFLVFLKAFCDQKGIHFIVGGVNNKIVISRFVDLGCYLFAGKVYGSLLSKDEIIKAFLA